MRSSAPQFVNFLCLLSLVVPVQAELSEIRSDVPIDKAAQRAFVRGSKECGGLISGLSPSLTDLDEDSCAILHALHHQQNPPDCKTARMLILDFDGYLDDGLGSVVHSTASALAEAYYENRTLILGPSKLAYRPGPWGCEHDLECYFKPLSTCGFADIETSEFQKLVEDPFSDSGRIKVAQEARGNSAALMCPTELKGDLGDEANRMWTSIVYNYVFRPRAEVAAHIFQQSKLYSMWDEPSVGLHVRRGDTHHTFQKKTFETEDYFEAAKSLTKETGASVWYLGTDSPQVTEEFREFAIDSEDIAVIVPHRERIREDKRKPESAISMASNARLNKQEYNQKAALEAVVDLWFLSECSAIVGTGTSHFVAIANVLRFVKGFKRGPIFLDAIGIADGSYNVGLFHSANLKHTNASPEDKRRRWDLVYERFVADALNTVRKYQFAYNTSTGLVEVPRPLFEKEIKAWRKSKPLSKSCPKEYVNVGSVDDTAILNNLGTELYQKQKMRLALACFVEAGTLNTNSEHAQISKENSQVLRVESVKFLVRPRQEQEQAEEGEEEDDETESATVKDNAKVKKEKRKKKKQRAQTKSEDGEGSSVDLTGITCPLDIDSPVQLSNYGTNVLYPEGRILEALKCFNLAMKFMDGDTTIADEVKDAVIMNIETIRNVTKPGNRGARVFHNIGKLGPEHPDSDDPLPEASDSTIQVWDGAMSEEMCQEIIDLFEVSEHYRGNLYQAGKIVVDNKHKKASEFYITGHAPSDSRWAKVEMQMMQIFIKYFIKYEELNPSLKDLQNPLGDEGFRMKRYINDGTEHHAYHADSGNEKQGVPRRILAMLFYLNDVEVGGETVFLNHGMSVKPKCGRVLAFPTAFPWVHAGKRPVSGYKYNIINFVSDSPS